jgi:hypothetical protein
MNETILGEIVVGMLSIDLLYHPATKWKMMG